MAQNNVKICLFVALTIASISLSAQNIMIGFGSGGGIFEMNSTKEFNQTIIKLLPFKPSLKDDFPPYFFYKAEVLYCFPKILAFGINIGTTSTGARLTLADYSGKYTFDNVQKGIFPGIKILLGKAPGTSNGLNFSLEGGAAFSTMITNRLYID